MDILKQINGEIHDFEMKPVTIVPGFTFVQKDAIEQIYRYYNSKFLQGDTDAEGNKMYFFNIVRNPCKVTTKAIDFDTKHINVKTAGGGDSLRTWYMERDLKHWMKEIGFGKVLNRIFTELPIFGSVVLKVIDNIPHFVDLRNFMVTPSADTLDKSGYIIEKHLYTPIELRKVGKKLGWNNIEQAIDMFRAMGTTYITVFERYGEVEKYDESGNPSYTYRRSIIADVGKDELDHQGNVSVTHPGVELENIEVKKHPYWEFHIEKISGRWLGVGIVEVLFDTQIKLNENANLESKGSYWAATQSFQCSDENVNRNLKSDVKDGEIIITDSPITPIDMTNKNLAFFNRQLEVWLRNRDEQALTFDVMRGERLPAGTPLGSARLAASMSSSYFAQIQEDIAQDVKKLLFKEIMPNFQKENSKEHILRLVGEDMDKVRHLIINQKAENALFDFIVKKKKLPSNVQFDLIKTAISERAKQGKELLVKIPASFYTGLKYKIDIIITGEQQDTQVYAQTLFALLQAITVDPTILTDPTKRKMLSKIAEAGGVSMVDILPDVMPSVEQLTEGMAPKKMSGGAGGGVSAPKAGIPGQGQVKTETTV